MTLLSIQQLSIGFRGPQLLDQVDCLIDAGQRIGLLGRNGSGKTTLMRMLMGQVEPDAGSITLTPGVQVGMLPQDVPLDIEGKVGDIVVPDHGRDDASESWQAEVYVDQILAQMQLDRDAEFASLSSGWKRRVLLAKALSVKPDILLLDEPTNHLDIDSIRWLEHFLDKWQGTLLFVTHDRMFLRKLSNRILEIDRGKLFDWQCDYDTFLKRKEQAIAAEEKQNELFDKKLAIEEAWIRQGIKARRTRNEGRVKALKKMRMERKERPKATGKVHLKIDEGIQSGALVIHAEELSFAYDQPIVDGLSTTVMRGDKVGLIGPNGVGKTTLLRLLLGDLEPQQGSVRLGTNLNIAYFDQLRGQLDEEQTVQQNVGDGSDTVTVNGLKKHVIGYLQDFLFTPERARTPVRFLSGGERNRVLLARLFARPANLLVLDEPTNDLDAETLELLEQRLVEYEGTILLVSHDREFLNNVVTSTLVFEEGTVKEYLGGYSDWHRSWETRQAEKTKEAEKVKQKQKTQNSPSPSPSTAKKLSYNQKRELEQLPQRIEQLESDIETLHQAMAEPDFYQQAGDLIAKESERLRQLEEELAAAYERWEELEDLA